MANDREFGKRAFEELATKLGVHPQMLGAAIQFGAQFGSSYDAHCRECHAPMGGEHRTVLRNGRSDGFGSVEHDHVPCPLALFPGATVQWSHLDQDMVAKFGTPEKK